MYDIYDVWDKNPLLGSMSDWDERKTAYGQLRDIVHKCNQTGAKIVTVVPTKPGSLIVITETESSL